MHDDILARDIAWFRDRARWARQQRDPVWLLRAAWGERMARELEAAQ